MKTAPAATCRLTTEPAMIRVKPVRRAGGLHSHVKVGRIQIVGGDAWPYQGNENVENEQNATHHGTPVAVSERDDDTRAA